jgi:hypothetical protein
VAVLLIALIAGGLLAGAVLLLVTANQAKSPSGSRIGAAVFAGLALALAPLVFYLWRRWRPPEAHHLQLRVEPVELRRGDAVSATLVISDAGKLGEKLELGLVCSEYYDEEKTVYTQNGSHKQRVTSTAAAFSEWSGPDRGQAQQTVRFTVPLEAPFSYEGGAVSWAWHVSVIDRHGHRPDSHRDVPVWVSP